MIFLTLDKRLLFTLILETRLNDYTNFISQQTRYSSSSKFDDTV